MQIKVKDLHKGHDLVKASHSMAQAFQKHGTMVLALEDVAKEYPNVLPEHLICLWLGINAIRQGNPSISDMEAELNQLRAISDRVDDFLRHNPSLSDKFEVED